MNQIWGHLRGREGMAAAGALVVAISLFLPWYGYSFLGYSVSIDGFHSYGLLSALGVVVMAFTLVAGARRSQLPGWAGIGRRSYLASGILMLAGSVLFLVAYHRSYSSGSVLFTYGPQPGVYLAILGSALALFGIARAGRRGTAS